MINTSTGYVMKNFIAMFLALVWINHSQAQSTRKLLIKADFTMYKENFPSAIRQYSEILKKNPKNENAKYHKLIAEHLTSRRGEDLSDLLAYEDSKGHSDKFYNYWLGRVHFKRYEFHLAKKHFDAFLNLNAYKSKEIIAETMVYLDQIALANHHYDKPTAFEVERLDYPINSKHDDLSPGFFQDQRELIFASSRPVGGVRKAQNEFLIFHTSKNTGEWEDPQAILTVGKLPPSAPKVEISNDQRRLFVFSQEYGGDLLVLQSKGAGWSAPQEFDSRIRGSRVESDFYINEAENHLLFATKRGGKGLDIYESRKGSDGLWTAPSAILGNINTAWDEDSPFLSEDGKTLYFSHNGPSSIGGFDVFKSQWDENLQEWSAPENLGFPVNTIDDEINYQINPDNISGFLSSNRLHSLGGYDIYYFHKEGVALASGTVRSLDGKPLAGIEVMFHPVKYTDETFRATTDINGNYEVQLFSHESFKVELALEDQVFHRDAFSSQLAEKNKLVRKDFAVDLPTGKATNFETLYTGNAEDEEEELELLGSRFRVGQKAVIRNAYFESGSAILRENDDHVEQRIKELIENYPGISIEIVGHTDNVEAPSNDATLSLQRANSFIAMLAANGIPTSKISARGEGADSPLATNDDEEEGRELNRRIEVRIVE